MLDLKSDVAATEAAILVDLEKIDLHPGAEAGVMMDLLHPVTGSVLGPKFHVLGGDSTTLRVNLRNIRDAAVANIEKEPRDPEAADTLNRARVAAASLKGWSDFTFGGQSVEFTTETAVKLLVARPWIADQILAFRDRRANFFKP